ncbi:MAG TPA: PDZ domain-containing protein [Flavitalea sp.]|nr:PDZ domain-containing protein [Flavitalea sp.]
MKRYLFSAAAILLLTTTAAIAQQTEKNPDALPQKENKRNNKKLKEFEEVIIKRKDPEKDAKVTIEIKDDEVFVDGKPIDDFVDDEVSVQKRDVNRFNFINPRSPFSMEEGAWSLDGEMHIEGDGEHAFLGVTTEGSSGGAKIMDVSENSAAAKAGLKKDDIISRVNDKSILDQEQLSAAIRAFKPDDKVTIIYKRDGKENKTTATLGKIKINRTRSLYRHGPDMPPMVFNFDNDQPGNFQFPVFRPKLGLKVQDTEDGKGVKVLDVEEGSAAEKAGIKQDDVITSFEGKEVTNAGELAKASREAKDKSSMQLQLNRNGKPQTIVVKVAKKLKTADL